MNVCEEYRAELNLRVHKYSAPKWPKRLDGQNIHEPVVGGTQGDRDSSKPT